MPPRRHSSLPRDATRRPAGGDVAAHPHALGRITHVKNLQSVGTPVCSGGKRDIGVASHDLRIGSVALDLRPDALGNKARSKPRLQARLSGRREDRQNPRTRRQKQPCMVTATLPLLGGSRCQRNRFRGSTLVPGRPAPPVRRGHFHTGDVLLLRLAV